ncbi:hypothetical protein BDV27DRAFT_122023 [Aspergillus caelatus]|uniref:Uncharacterized protein n=1 Tax=Aspergillus caelatus TaxID=61420 RepID=A0A5N7AFK1_9EURO|nr:uncharacterized protein BDV27DRAFT_122023 [Aspergillus caelatus]KAE8368602.1 hypothetical protein BDV27DRAFT_122023 [Aspergillus caelatus]
MVVVDQVVKCICVFGACGEVAFPVVGYIVLGQFPYIGGIVILVEMDCCCAELSGNMG